MGTKVIKKTSIHKPCSHKNVIDEVVLGHKTGDYECAHCGRKFTPDEWRKFKLKN